MTCSGCADGCAFAGYLYGTLESERLMSVIEKGAVDEFDVERMYISKGDSGGGEGAH